MPKITTVRVSATRYFGVGYLVGPAREMPVTRRGRFGCDEQTRALVSLTSLSA
jgi:hypothetical protein